MGRGTARPALFYKNRAAIARPAPIRRMHDKPDFLQIAANALENSARGIFLGSMADENADDFTRRNVPHHFAIDPGNGREFARPVTGVVRPGEPGGFMRFPFGGHPVTQVGGSCCVCGLQVRHKDARSIIIPACPGNLETTSSSREKQCLKAAWLTFQPLLSPTLRISSNEKF